MREARQLAKVAQIAQDAELGANRGAVLVRVVEAQLVRHVYQRFIIGLLVDYPLGLDDTEDSLARQTLYGATIDVKILVRQLSRQVAMLGRYVRLKNCECYEYVFVSCFSRQNYKYDDDDLRVKSFSLFIQPMITA